jgi:Protein of unknown function (DUF3102)
MVTTASQITKADEEFLREAAARVRQRINRSAEYIIEIGRDLIAVKDRVGHGNFLPWIEREFGMSDDTAARFMNVARNMAAQIPHGGAEFAPAVLYALAAPSTPGEVRTEITDRVTAGEKVTVADVRESKARAYIAEHGTPELISAVAQGAVSSTAAVAFVRKYPPSQQDNWIMRGGGSVVDAVTLANVAAMKAKTAGQTVAATPGLFADVKAKADRAASKTLRPTPDPKPAADRADIRVQAKFAADQLTESAQDSLERLHGWLVKAPKPLPDDAVKQLTDALRACTVAFERTAYSLEHPIVLSTDASGRKAS